MKLSTHIASQGIRLGDEGTIRLLREIGFDAYDYSIMPRAGGPEDHPVFREDWREHLLSLRALSDELGIECNQSHAPFPTRKMDEPENGPYNAGIMDRIIRAIEAASMLGAKVIVVHSVKAMPYLGREDYWRDLNLDIFRSLAPYAKRFGIRIGLEDLFNYDPGRRTYIEATGMRPAEMCAMLDALGDDCFTACLDFGHAQLAGYSVPDYIRFLGRDRLGALHVHDNYGRGDDHLPPFSGMMKWGEIAQALGEIDYQGDFTLECERLVMKMPETLIPSAMRYLHDVSREVMKMVEEHRPA